MPNFNKVILAGHITRDITLSFLPSQLEVAEFGIAVSEKWKAKDGQQKEETCFIDCQVFGKRAVTLEKYVKKGDPILIEGRLRLNQWTTQDGQKKSKHRVLVDNFTFLGSVSGGKKQDEPKPLDPEHSVFDAGFAWDDPIPF